MNFSIVSYLSGEEYEKVRRIQEKLSEITGSRKCLDEWLPHITVGDGIVVPEDMLAKTERDLEEFSKKKNSLSIGVKGFGGIENWKGAVLGKITPYVIWLDVEVRPDLLGLFNDLRDEITSHYDTWLPRTVDYKPHITLAFADLSEDGYRKGMEYLKDRTFHDNIHISTISLVECYGEGNMTSKEYKRYVFGSGIVY